MESANLLVPKREKWTTSSPNEFWGTDMTKALTPGQVWVYVHAVIDWQAALNAQFPQGIAEIPEGKRPFLVSDPGYQPTLKSHKNYHKSFRIRQIFASYSNPKGNADTERVIPKREKWATNPGKGPRSKPRTATPNEFWGTDMTKVLILGQGWVYVHAVID